MPKVQFIEAQFVTRVVYYAHEIEMPEGSTPEDAAEKVRLEGAPEDIILIGEVGEGSEPDYGLSGFGADEDAALEDLEKNEHISSLWDREG